MKKKEVNINEESTSAGGAHAVNKFRISDFVMMAVIVILCASCVLPFLHVAVKSISGNTAVTSDKKTSPSMLTRRYLQITP